MNLAYRWFIGYPLNEAVPHFATVSYNFKHRFNTASVEYVFRWVLKAAADEGYLDTEAIFVDGTHMSATSRNICWLPCITLRPPLTATTLPW